MPTDTTTLRSLADDIDAMRHVIRQRDATIILLQAELDTLRRENALLRSGIDTSAEYVSGFADGANLTTIWREAQCVDLSESFGVPMV